MKKEKENFEESYKATMFLMRVCYKEYREKWEGEDDDRRIFCNIYDLEMKALDIMKDIHNNTIWVGFNMKFDEDKKMMDEIIDYFKGKEIA